MKKIIIVLAVLSLNACAQKPNFEQEFLANNPDFQNRFETEILEIYKNNKFYGDFIIGIVNETGLVYSYKLNRDILEGKPTTLSNDSPIYTASHTKAFTGTLLKILEDDNILSLDKTIADYLPELPFDGSVDTKNITLRHLLNHTNGINHGPFLYKTAFTGYEETEDELLKSLNTGFVYDDSKKFQYSNTGPILAAMAAHNITGNLWKDEMKNRIFEPLGMNNTSAYLSDYNAETILPALEILDNKLYRKVFPKKDITMHAAGGILSTVNDMAKWLQSNINQDNTIIKDKESWQELHGVSAVQDRTFFTYKRHAYSLGWDIATYENDTILTRFGSLGSIRFHGSFMPERKIGIVAFFNDGRANGLVDLAANYAYNLINKKPNTETTFEIEKEQILSRFEKQSKQTSQISIDSILTDAPEYDKFLGHYKNENGWADVRITKAGNHYNMHWGVLSGSIFKINNSKRPYIGVLGSLYRSLKIEGDTLVHGTLKYIKVKR